MGFLSILVFAQFVLKELKKIRYFFKERMIKERMQEEFKHGKKKMGSCYGPHGFYPSFFFLHSPLSSCSSPPPSVVLLSPFLAFLALAGHAAAVEVFGSLGFMVAAPLLSNDKLVNSDLNGMERHFIFHKESFE